jgi:hypothetical protein
MRPVSGSLAEAELVLQVLFNSTLPVQIFNPVKPLVFVTCLSVHGSLLI